MFASWSFEVFMMFSVIATNIKSEWFPFPTERRMKNLNFWMYMVFSEKSVWVFRDCYAKSGSEYKGSSSVGVQASI